MYVPLSPKAHEAVSLVRFSLLDSCDVLCCMCGFCSEKVSYTVL